MKCAFISDLHIKEQDDLASEKLTNFFSHEAVQNCDEIYLLGDIFEYMVGEHKQYTQKYYHFFEAIVESLNRGKKIIFIEGNHDFHFERTITNYLIRHTKNHHNFSYRCDSLILLAGNKRYFVCHGYEVDYYNKYFKKWHRIYTSRFMKFFVSYVLPFQFIQKLGELASKDSKRRGRKTFDYNKMKAKYLFGAKALITRENVDGIIGGHTHIKESHVFEDGTCYYNVGYPKRDGHFLYLDESEFKMCII